MIIIKNLSKKYTGNNKPTLDNISYEFNNTGLYYLIGKSGSGKSTFLSIVGGMDFSFDGSVFVDGIDIKKMSKDEKDKYRYEKISFMFQDFKGVDETVNDNLMQVLSITSLSKEEKEERITNLLKQVELSDYRKRKIKSLSGGQRKRISLVRALLKDAPILLCDEPVSSLNKELRKKVIDMLTIESKRRLVIIITHEEIEDNNKISIIKLRDGKFEDIKSFKNDNETIKVGYKRKRYFGITPFIDILKIFKRRHSLLIASIITLTISLFTISFSFLLSNGVNSSLSSSLSTYMDNNSLVISNNDESFISNGLKSVDYTTIEYIKNKHSKYVGAYSYFYLDSLNETFKSNQSFLFEYRNKKLNFNKISLDNFIEYEMPFEINEENIIYGKKSDLNYDEVILGLNEETITALYILLFDESITYIDEQVLIDLSNILVNEEIYLKFKANNQDLNISIDSKVKVVGIINSTNNFVCHSKDDFAEIFLENRLNIPGKLYEEDSESFAFNKTYGVRLYNSLVGSFLDEFLNDKNLDQLTLQSISNQKRYKKTDIKTHNRFYVLKDYLPRLSVERINSFVNNNSDLIEEINYSTPIYTFTAGGYISGFQKPFFFSRYLEKLNQIQDNSNISSENLQAFQGANIVVPDGVIKSDLISSMNKDGLKFKSIDKNNMSIYHGKVPSSYDEIAISSKLADELFLSSTYALGEKIYTLTLTDTIKKGDSYENIFTQGELRICGIYKNDETTCIYHKSLFPLCYSFMHNQIRPDDIRIENIMLKVNLTDKDSNFYINEIKKYGDYSISFPMLTITDEIKKTMNKLATIFFIFAIISGVCSLFLLLITLSIVLSKEKKKIGILMSLGYSSFEISTFYISFSMFIGILSYIFSIFITKIAEHYLMKTLLEMMSNYSMSFLFYLPSLAISLISTFLIGLILSLQIAHFDPKIALSKR